jgi:pimeloyl-ACP methyl ester carboxylesterase
VLFVHSLAGNVGHWGDALAQCRSARRAIAFDLRGHGRSGGVSTEAAFAIEALAGDIAAVADACGLERFVLVGHSLGGGVALAYAGAHPERVERLLLLDPIGDGTRIPAEKVQPIIDRQDTDH